MKLSDILKQIAEDLENRPGELCFQTSYLGSGFIDTTPTEALRRLGSSDYEVRPKPPTCAKWVVYPEPQTEPLEEGQLYYIGGNTYSKWSGDSFDLMWLRQGRIFLTREDKEAYDIAIWGEVLCETN